MFIKTVTGVKHDGIRRLHDLLVNLLSKWLRRAKITHTGGVGGYKHTCKGLFTGFINHLPKLDPNSPTYAGLGTDFSEQNISVQYTYVVRKIAKLCRSTPLNIKSRVLRKNFRLPDQCTDRRGPRQRTGRILILALYKFLSWMRPRHLTNAQLQL